MNLASYIKLINWANSNEPCPIVGWSSSLRIVGNFPAVARPGVTKN